jgi:signal transduction histidine kinase
LVAPWPIRGIAAIDRFLIGALLSPTEHDRRMMRLQETRTAAVEDSALTLRRLERDLHDGTQARLVTVAMALGRAEERIAAGGDPRDLISAAHADTKDALKELRELVRGIHPPALDLGLAPALETLASRSAVPVDLDIYLPVRPSPGIEAIVYFSVAELLTNVVKHAEATRAWVAVRSVDGDLVVTVRDNGRGGANLLGGSGLSGLASRVGTVDGSLDVVSPAGGPTIVTLALPASGSR